MFTKNNSVNSQIETNEHSIVENEDNRRKNSRYAYSGKMSSVTSLIDYDAQSEHEEELHFDIIEIGGGGMKIKSQSQLPVNTTILFKYKDKITREMLYLFGKICWIDSKKNRQITLGIEFC